MKCEARLHAHEGLGQRRRSSEALLGRVKAAIAQCKSVQRDDVTIFCAGSLAREESGTKSDLDLFVITDGDEAVRRRLYELTLFGELIAANAKLGFPEISNDGEYLKLHHINTMKLATGLPKDDSENLFTARMLLILESHPLSNAALYDRHLNGILEHYYRDQRDKASFRPLFLLNDLLRYWRTLCLNYEARRHDTSKPWRKKNVNLKFSRMVTVFGTVLPLIVEPNTSVVELRELCKLPPLRRLARGLDLLNDGTLAERWTGILDMYEAFLTWKEDDDPDKYLADGAHKAITDAYATALSEFLHAALTHSRIAVEYRRFLIL